MSDFGIKISRPGIDVGTAETKDLVLDSRVEGSFKIHGTYTLEVTDPGFAFENHDLGYAPAFMANVTYSGNGSTHAVPFMVPNSTLSTVYTNGSQVGAYARSFTGSTATFKVILFRERIHA